MLGTFAGAIMLTKISSQKFFMWNLFSAFFHGCNSTIKSSALAWILVFLIGLAVANIWPLVFQLQLENIRAKQRNIRTNDDGNSGGAVIPLLVGWIGEKSNLSIGMLVLVACMIYLWVVSMYCLKKEK